MKKRIAQTDDLIAQGLAKELIRLSDDGKCVEYLNHGISRDWTKPEAIVEAKAYLTLGSSLREADIEVYADAEDIGFDATGKPTKVNELDEIGVALAKFIKDENGEGL